MNTFLLELNKYHKRCGAEDKIFGAFSIDAVISTSNLAIEEHDILRPKLHTDAFSDTVELDIFFEQTNTHNIPDSTILDIPNIVPLVERPHFFQR